MKFIVFPLTGLLAGCGDKVIVPDGVPHAGAPSLPARVSRQAERSKPHVDSVKTGSQPTQPSIAAEEPVTDLHVAERAIAALAAVNDCVDPLMPAMKRRLGETADVSEPMRIREWLVSQCGAQLDALRSFRSAVLDADTRLEIVQILTLVESDIVAAGEALARAKMDFVLRCSGRFDSPPIWTDGNAQAEFIATAVADARSRQGFWLVEEEYVRWQNDPRELNLRDSEAAAYIGMAEAKVESLGMCLDGLETRAVGQIVAALTYSDSFVEDPAIVCAAEMEWSESQLLVHAGAARAAPLIAERLALNERIRALAELRRGARRLFQTRMWVMGQFTSFVDRHGSLQALVAAVRSLDQNNRADPENYPSALRPELVRWAAEPLNPYAQVLVAPVSTAAGLEALAMCVNSRSEPMRESLRDVANAARIQQILTDQLIACYNPMMGLAQFLVQHSGHVSAAEYLAFQVLVRRLYIHPRALTTVIASFRSDHRLSPFNERVANLRAMEGAAEFVSPAVVESLERFRY